MRHASYPTFSSANSYERDSGRGSSLEAADAQGASISLRLSLLWLQRNVLFIDSQDRIYIFLHHLWIK